MTTATDTLGDLVAAVDLPALVEQHAGHGRHSGGRWLFHCPNPTHADTHPSFTVQRSRNGKWHARCQSQCNWHGDALDLVRWLNGGSVADAAQQLRAWLGRPEPVRTSSTPARPHRPQRHRHQVRNDEQPQQIPADTAAAVLGRYLAQRGWPDDTPELFGLSVVADRWGRPRIRHPFHAWDPTSEQWVVAAWQDRATGTAKPKWMTPAGVTLPLYNVAALDTPEPPTGVVVCEGPADTITASLALRARPGWAAVGVAGANGWQPGWALLLGGAAVVIAADPDTAGQNLTNAVLADLGRAAVVLNLAAGDLTDTARHAGLDAVAELLTGHLDSPELATVTPDSTTPDDTAQPAERPPPWVEYAHLERLGPHRWVVCDTCHQAALTALHRRCRITAGCVGHYVPAPAAQGVVS
jgi:hypothetical protein